MKFSARPFALGTTLLLAIAQIARACDCAPPPPPCEAIGQSPLVFLGSVLTVSTGAFTTAKMRVDQSFKGSLKGEVELFDNGMCDGPDLQVGHQYLMYSFATPTGAIPARGCTRSRAVEYADEDLQFLKNYVAGKTITQISGTVLYRPDESDDSRLGEQGRTPLKDVSVTISGANGSYKAKTDATGRYAVSNIPPGQYEVNAELGGYRAVWVRDEFQLAEKGCAVADVLMKVDRRVAGIVRSRDGEPVAGALVEMVPTKPRSERWQNPVLLDVSDKNGLYAIDSIPPGEYYLGINISHTPTKEHPYAPNYYPNTPDKGGAAPVPISIGAAVHSYDLTAPPKLKVVSVRGRIADASGAPPLDGPQVRVMEPGLYGQIDPLPLAVDAEGRFQIDLCEGVRYSAYAFSGFSKGTVYSEPIEFTAGDTELRFVLNKNQQEFNNISRKLEQR